ncbi:MAG: copper homeostasis protein CutC [Planctomycetota bacterium]
MQRPLVEICLESVDCVLAAERAGADRVELCSDLVEGGLTPSLGAVRKARRRSALPIMVMIRPCGGDFLYSDAEFAVMLEDIRAVREASADGVVFGVLTEDGELDRERTRELIEEARPLAVTFHRAFDMTRDSFGSLEHLVELGVDRVLTSGRADSAALGAGVLRALVRAAGDRIVAMPGGGIDARNIAAIRRETGARELHFAAFGSRPSAMRYRNPAPRMGAAAPPGEYERRFTDEERVRRTIEALQRA